MRIKSRARASLQHSIRARVMPKKVISITK